MRRTGTPLVLLLGLSILISGCIGPDEADVGATSNDDGPADDTSMRGADEGTDEGTEGTDDEATNGNLEGAEDEPGLPVTMHMTDCSQFHMFFDVAWEDVKHMVPEGFGPQGQDPAGATTQVYQHYSTCDLLSVGGTPEAADGDGASELWTAILVSPPDEYADEDLVVQAVPIQHIAFGRALFNTYTAWGFDEVLTPGVSLTYSGQGTGGGPVDHTRVNMVVETARATYTYDMTWSEPVFGDAAGTGRVYRVADGAVTGWYEYSWPGWTDEGYGPVAFQQEGDDDAPPVAQGTVHIVSDVDITATLTELTSEP